MARRKVVVKRLNAIQNFGAMDVLCTDKTGTLTQDKIILEHHVDVTGRSNADVLRLGWLNSYLGLMAPGFVSAFGVFFMRQYISGIPSEYMDAARIDGASEPRVYWSVIMPKIRPAIVTLAIFRFLWEWDSLLWPLVIITNDKLRTLPLALTYFVEQLGWSPHFTMVHVLIAAVLATVPVLLFFLLLQRYFINAMTMAGLGSMPDPGQGELCCRSNRSHSGVAGGFSHCSLSTTTSSPTFLFILPMPRSSPTVCLMSRN